MDKDKAVVEMFNAGVECERQLRLTTERLEQAQAGIVRLKAGHEQEIEIVEGYVRRHQARAQKLEAALRAMLGAFDGALGGLDVSPGLFTRRVDAVDDAWAALAEGDS